MKPLRAVGRFIARYYSIFLLLAAYEAMSRFGLVSPRLFPSLVVIAEQLWKYAANGDLIYQAGISLHRALLGFIRMASVYAWIDSALWAACQSIAGKIEPLSTVSAVSSTPRYMVGAMRYRLTWKRPKTRPTARHNATGWSRRRKPWSSRPRNSTSSKKPGSRKT